ncbi:hypothetical protein [Paraburkholderia sp. SIMBA_054]|uniref:hypothetical protein n=1 Tax=Paraburkholderia sp. SIMBA_054 TaxID=3085795 RepID=UPI00397B3793
MRTQFNRSVKRPVKLPALFRHTASQELELKIIPHAHLQAVIDGRGGENEFLTVVYRVMVGGSLTSYADEEGERALEGIFTAALNALINIGERYEQLQKFSCLGDEIYPVKEALNMTDDLQALTTRKQQSQVYLQVSHFVGSFAKTMRNLRALQEKYQ